MISTAGYCGFASGQGRLRGLLCLAASIPVRQDTDPVTSSAFLAAWRYAWSLLRLFSSMDFSPPQLRVKVGVKFNSRRNTMSAKKQTATQEPMPEKNHPANVIRLGRIKGTIWANKTEKGTFYSVQIIRIYRDEDQWKEGTSFNRDDLPLVAKVADLVHTYIFESQAGEE
jgi:hypothetical protein